MIRPLLRLEAAVFANAHRGAKGAAFWFLLLALCVPYGITGSPLNKPSLITFLQDPPAWDGAPVSFSFTSARRAPASLGGGLELDTTAGWLPVADPPPEGLEPGEIVSLAGRFRGDGAFVAERLLRHPKRAGKVWVSLATLIALTAAVAWQGARLLRRGRPSPT